MYIYLSSTHTIVKSDVNKVHFHIDFLVFSEIKLLPLMLLANVEK